MGDKKTVKEESMFDEEAWAGWEPPTKKKAIEDRAMKVVLKLMAELKEEIDKYSSERCTKKYKNVKARLSQITK